MSKKIQHARGIEDNIPTLDVAEIGFTTDTKKVFIGDGDTNIELAKKTDFELQNTDIEAMLINKISDMNALIQNITIEFNTFKSCLTEGFTSNQFSHTFDTLNSFTVTTGYHDTSLKRLVI